MSDKINDYSGINVYSEIGQLKKVLVHTPGKELEYLTPQRLEELLYGSLVNPIRATKEHQEFVKILEDNGIEAVQLSSLVSQTYDAVDNAIKEKFIQQFLDESIPKLDYINRQKTYEYLKSLESNSEVMIRKMMSGILASEARVQINSELVCDPMPNLVYTRDPFASVGNGVTIHRMLRPTRNRETIFASFIFNNHPIYKHTPRYYDRTYDYSIEGGDVFVYDDKTLVVGISERTENKAIQLLAQKVKADQKTTFEHIFAINVPKMSNLMHLDTWLTMVDYDKFIYSPNMMDVLKIWEIDLRSEKIEWKEVHRTLQEFLTSVINKPAILVPVAGKNATHISIDVETNFDATNYLTIAPGVVVGYDRNYKTEAALRAAGITVLSWNGDQLSLGMGSARCMSMPLYREPITRRH